ncbi:MAG: PD-(D/E)XK nuclease family protein [bacterium]|nr:PD-(D/E)XK nuclease family protein [bacterium]
MKIEKLIQSLDFIYKLKHKLTFNSTISYSTASYYIKCPYLFKLIEVFGFTPPKTNEQIVGICTHKTLEMCVKNRVKNINEVERIFDTFWEKSLPDSYYKNAKEAVLFYFENELIKADILYVEKKIKFRINNGFVIGFVDRVDKFNDGIKVVDYKTYFFEPPYDFYKNDIQLHIYSYGLRKEGLNPIVLEYVFIGIGKKLEIPASIEAEEKAIEKLESIMEKIKRYEFTPNLSYCNYCILNNICIKRT